MTMSVPISTSIDLVVAHPIPLSAVGSMHDFFGIIPPAPSPTPLKPGIAVEIFTPLYWPPGDLMGKNRLSKTVRSRGLSIALAGHDVGNLIMHLQVAPPPTLVNIETAFHFLFSSRAMVFDSSVVVFEGKGVATAGTSSFLPMNTCGQPIKLPNSAPVTNFLNSVVVGMSFGDLLVGAFFLVADVAVSWLLLSGLKKIFPSEGVTPVPSQANFLRDKAVAALLPGFVTKTGAARSRELVSWATKSALSNLKSAANSLRWGEPLSLSLSAQGQATSAKATVTFADEGVEVSAAVRGGLTHGSVELGGEPQATVGYAVWTERWGAPL